MALAASVVVSEVSAAWVLQTRLVARRYALHPTQAIQQLVLVTGAVVGARTEGQVVWQRGMEKLNGRGEERVEVEEGQKHWEHVAGPGGLLALRRCL